MMNICALSSVCLGRFNDEQATYRVPLASLSLFVALSIENSRTLAPEHAAMNGAYSRRPTVMLATALSLSRVCKSCPLCTYGRMEREVVDGASVCVEHGALDERAARHVELVQRLSYRSRAAVSHRTTPQSLTHALGKCTKPLPMPVLLVPPPPPTTIQPAALLAIDHSG